MKSELELYKEAFTTAFIFIEAHVVDDPDITGTFSEEAHRAHEDYKLAKNNLDDFLRGRTSHGKKDVEAQGELGSMQEMRPVQGKEQGSPLSG